MNLRQLSTKPGERVSSTRWSSFDEIDFPDHSYSIKLVLKRKSLMFQQEFDVNDCRHSRWSYRNVHHWLTEQDISIAQWKVKIFVSSTRLIVVRKRNCLTDFIFVSRNFEINQKSVAMWRFDRTDWSFIGDWETMKSITIESSLSEEITQWLCQLFHIALRWFKR